MILYIVAVVLTDGATTWRRSVEGSQTFTDDSKEAAVEKMYGSLHLTIYTLLSSMTGGMNWRTAADPLLVYSHFYFVMFLFFIVFALFSVMNIVTGVFVDG